MKLAALACLLFSAGIIATAGERNSRPGPRESTPRIERDGPRYLFPDFFEPGTHAALVPSSARDREFTLTKIAYFHEQSSTGYFRSGVATHSLGRIRLKAREVAAIESHLQAGPNDGPKMAAVVAKLLKRMRSQYRVHFHPIEPPLPRPRVLDDRDLMANERTESRSLLYSSEPQAEVVLPGREIRGPL